MMRQIWLLVNEAKYGARLVCCIASRRADLRTGRMESTTYQFREEALGSQGCDSRIDIAAACALALQCILHVAAPATGRNL